MGQGKKTPEIVALLGTMPDEQLARQVGVTVRTIAKWRADENVSAHGNQGPKRKPKEPPEPPGEPAYDVSSMTAEEFAKTTLDELTWSIHKATERGSWTAVAQLNKRREEAYAMLQEARQGRDPYDEMTDEQLLELVLNALNALPREYVQRVGDVAGSIVTPSLSVVK